MSSFEPVLAASFMSKLLERPVRHRELPFWIMKDRGGVTLTAPLTVVTVVSPFRSITVG